MYLSTRYQRQATLILILRIGTDQVPVLRSKYKRARVSLTLRLICGYFLRSLLPFLTFILWNITGLLNIQLIKATKYLLLYSCVTAVSAFPCVHGHVSIFRYGRAIIASFPVRPGHGFFLE